MHFDEFIKYLQQLEDTSSRNRITEILAELLKKSSLDEIDKVVFLALGKVAPGYESVVFNMADKMVVRAVAQAFDKQISQVNDLYKKKGDVGEAARELAQKSKSEKDFGVGEVFNKLVKIAKDEGKGSQERKVDSLAHLLSKLSRVGAKYICRIVLGRLRLGFSEKTVIDAISWMVTGDKSKSNTLDRAYQVMPNVGLLAKNVKKSGVEEGVKRIKPKVGIPVLPMLAQRLKSPEDMIKKMGKVSVESKLDGLRIMIHFSSGKNGFVKAYTRNLNENSWMFPELKNMGKFISANSVILDSEAVGLDEDTKKQANFQATMTRRRKHDIEQTLKKIGIEFFVFDILSLDGENLMQLPYHKRREILEKTVREGGLFRLVDAHTTQVPEDISDLYKQKIKQGYEGVLVKKYDSRYIPGRTGWRWVKMKQVEEAKAKLSDTIDAVVMGYTAGKGKRTSFGVGQFLVGIVDQDKIKTTTKIGTGLTDKQFKELKKRLDKIQVQKKPKEYEVTKNYIPDYWVKPELVVEIAADEITKSPSHTAGLALRFPRLIRFRDDKGPEEATTLKELKNLNDMQK